MAHRRRVQIFTVGIDITARTFAAEYICFFLRESARKVSASRKVQKRWGKWPKLSPATGVDSPPIP